ncbi:MAG TPA: peptidase M23 [Gammaproteobacteria bacterium]|nr:peptidase M23 [Gammaproteobacteria bacterium]
MSVFDITVDHSKPTTSPLRLAATLLLVVLLAIPQFTSAQPSSLSAEERARKEQELQALRQRIEALRRDLNRIRGEHDEARAELQKTESRIGKLVQNLRKIKRRLRQKKQRLKKLRRDRNRLREEVAAQRDLLARQVRAAYIIGRQEYLKLLLNQEDPALAGRMFTYYEYFNRARAHRIDEARADLEKLARVETDIRRAQKKLQALLKQHRRDKAALDNTIQARKLLVARLKSELRNRSDELAHMIENERQLEKLLNVIQEMLADIPAEAGLHKPFASLRGKLAWPAVGRVKKLFGRTRAGGRVKWNGIIIRAPEGNNVRAVARGRVAYADWLRGYGLLIILDHGDGYMSLYGNNQSLLRETGDWVEAGDIIAAVGKSGGKDNVGLYFEIRHNGKPSNPVKWCRKP